MIDNTDPAYRLHPRPTERVNDPPRKRTPLKSIFKWGCLSALAGIAMLAVLIFIAGFQPQPVAEPLNLDEVRPLAVTLTFEQLARDTESYVDTWVILQGQVVQVTEGANDYVVVRVNITEGKYGWTDAVWVNYTALPRLLEGDLIEFLGQVEGRRTYKAVLGNSITVPEITAYEATILPQK